MKSKRLLIFTVLLLVIGMTLWAAPKMVDVKMFMFPHSAFDVTLNPDTAYQVQMNRILNPEGINVVVDTVPFSEFNDKQLAMCVAGDTPDFGFVNMMVSTPLFKAGYFEPLDSYVKATKAFNYNKDLLPGPWGNSKYKGVIYGIPFEGDDRLLFLNKTCFKNAGVPLPPTTDFLKIGWDGFLALAKKLTKDLNGDGTIDQYGFGFVGGEHNHFIHDAGDLWHQIDAEMVNEDATEARCNKEPFVRTVQLYVDLYKAKAVPPDVLNYMSYADVEKMFASNKVAMWIVGPWEVDTLPKLNPQIEFLVTDLPLAKDGHKASSGGGWHLGIYKGAKNKKEAWRAIEVLVTKVDPMTFGMYKPAMAKEPWSGPAYAKFVEYLPYTKSPTYAFTGLDEAWKTCMEEIQKAILGQKTAQKAMDDAAVKINQILKR